MSERVVKLFEPEDDIEPKKRPIDLAHQENFSLGSIEVAPSLRKISGPEGEIILEPKVMQVLVVLGTPPDTIFSRDDLIEQCWDGRIVGDASINRVISLLRTGMRDAGGDEVSVETVPKVGYRMLVRETGVSAGDMSEHGEGALFAVTAQANSRKFLFAGIAMLVALAGAFFGWQQWQKPSAYAPLTIAMMPLDGTDISNPLIVSGFEAELRSEMARGNSVTVASGATAKQLSARFNDLGEIGRRMAAKYVFSGGLAENGDRVTLQARIVSSDSGETVWQQDFASASEQSGNLPHRAARAALEALGRPANSELQSNAVSFDDYEQYLLAQGMIRARDPSQYSSALALLEGVTTRNPEFSAGWSARAKALFFLSNSQPQNFDEDNKTAFRFADRALELDPLSTEALKVLGILSDDSAERHTYLSKAVELDPGDSEAWLWFASVSAVPQYAQDEAEAVQRLAEIDPLWSRAWQSSFSVAALQKGLDTPLELDRMIEAAAVEPWQAQAAQARMANLQGDVSEFYRLSLKAMPALSPGERQVHLVQLTNMLSLMDIELNVPRPRGSGGLVFDVINGKLPAQEEFIDNGLTGLDFWSVTPLIIGAPSLYIKDGREAELIAHYDSAFGSPEALEQFAQRHLLTHHFISNTSTYLGYALKKVGREEEANALFALGEKSVALWHEHDAMSMTPWLFEANIAAAQGQSERAIGAIKQLLDFNWPYAMQSPGVSLTGPLLGDPIWEELNDEPALAAALNELRANLAKEKSEIEAQIGS